MNRPQKMNALNAGLANAIVDGLRRFNAARDAWVGILTGTGKAFCAGADLENMRIGSADGGLGRCHRPPGNRCSRPSKETASR